MFRVDKGWSCIRRSLKLHNEDVDVDFDKNYTCKYMYVYYHRAKHITRQKQLQLEPLRVKELVFDNNYSNIYTFLRIIHVCLIVAHYL